MEPNWKSPIVGKMAADARFRYSTRTSGQLSVQRRFQAVYVLDASRAALREQSCNAATGKSYTKGKLLERAWRTHRLLCPLQFARADGHGRNSFAPHYRMFQTSLVPS